MDETQFDWDDLRLFMAVAKHGGLAGASEESGKSAPTLGRRMLILERHLNQTLFERKNTGYDLTEQGQALMQKAMSVNNIVAPITTSAPYTEHKRVKVSAGCWTTVWLCRSLNSIAMDQPITYQFIAADEELDIPHREAVIGVRNKRVTHPSLASRRVGHVEFAVYASNAEVQPWVHVLGTTPSALWVAEHASDNAKVEVSHPRSALDLAVSGVAKAVLPRFIGDNEPGLIQVGESIPALQHDRWLVCHHDDRHLPEVRQALTFIGDALLADTTVS